MVMNSETPNVQGGSGINPSDTNALRAALANIDVLDAAEGLSHLGGRAAMYLDLLQRFVTTHVNDVAEIRRALKEGRTADAVRVAHILKGVTDTLSVRELPLLAASVEATLLNAEGDAEIGRVVGALDAALARAIKALEPLRKSSEAASGA